MDQQQIENTIQFLVENQAKFHSELELLKDSVQIIAENQKETNTQIQELTSNIEAMRLETQEAFNNLIIGNEATRDLANQMGRLIVNVSQRLTIVEKRLDEQ
jgi:hypothetical protein